MARRFRPHIPLAIRCQVASRQLREANIEFEPFAGTLTVRLQQLLDRLFGDAKVELHHRPALVNRPWNARKGDYDTPANSAAHLVYLVETDHDIETRIRGIGAQRSDLSQARYLKKVARNRSPKPKRGPKIQSRGFDKSGSKHKFQKRVKS